MDDGIDTGNILLRESLSLEGSLNEIFERMIKNDYKMIIKIINSQYRINKQQGKSTFFKRRKPEQSELKHLNYSKKYLYNFIRMLADPYPNAFLKIDKKRIVFKSVIQINKGLSRNLFGCPHCGPGRWLNFQYKLSDSGGNFISESIKCFPIPSSSEEGFSLFSARDFFVLNRLGEGEEMSTDTAVTIETTKEQVLDIYKKMEKNLEVVRRRLNRPLPLAEKVLLGHLSDPENQERAG